MNYYNPFHFAGPIEPNSGTPFFMPGVADSLASALVAKELCLLIAPPGGGSTSTLFATGEKLRTLVKNPLWVYIDLKSLQQFTAPDLYGALAKKARSQYPSLFQLTESIDNQYTLLAALQSSARSFGSPLILAIDHIESISRDLAISVIGMVRHLYGEFQRELGNEARAVSAILTGSSILFRQSITRRSPLKVGLEFILPDLTQRQVAAFLSQSSRSAKWSFSAEAIEYLASQTSGDRYLLQRLASDCVAYWHSQVNQGEISKSVAIDAVERFVDTAITSDSQLKRLLPALIQDGEAVKILVSILKEEKHPSNVHAEIPFDFSPELTRVLKVYEHNVHFRNMIYQRILSNSLPLLDAASNLHLSNRRNFRIGQKIRELVGMAELATNDIHVLRELISDIALFANVENAVLLSYGEAEKAYYLEASTKSAHGDFIGRKVLSGPGPFDNKFSCPVAEFICDQQCSQQSTGRACTWLPLQVEGTIVGQLGLIGDGWIHNQNNRAEMSALCNSLASLLEARITLRGLQRLSAIRVRVAEEDANLQEICLAIAMIFNKSRTCIWIGNSKEGHANLRSEFGEPKGTIPPMDQDYVTVRNVQDIAHLAIYDGRTLQNPSFDGLLAKYHLKALLITGFTFGKDGVGIIGIGSTVPWKLTEREEMLLQISRDWAITLLSDLGTIKLTQTELESSQNAVNILGHELKRWPGVVNRELDLLKMGTYGDMNERQLEQLTMIQSWTESYIALCERIVTASSLHSEMLIPRFEVVSVHSLIKESFWELEHLLEESGKRLKLHMEDEGNSHRIDKTLWRLLIENLLANSAQYADGKVVRLSVLTLDAKTLISIQDIGKGIPPHARSNIFNRFDRGVYNGTRVSRPGNLGLGLYFVRKIAELHGGTVYYDSSYGKGAKFVVALPKYEYQGGQDENSADD